MKPEKLVLLAIRVIITSCSNCKIIHKMTIEGKLKREFSTHSASVTFEKQWMAAIADDPRLCKQLIQVHKVVFQRIRAS